MIAQLSGRVVEVGASAAVLDVGGVGFEILATPTTLASLREGDTATVHTYLLTREDVLALYGFATPDERACFQALLGVAKIGPKIALGALAVFTPDALRAAVEAGDEAALTRIPGVGKKSAQRLIIEIGDKLGPATSPAPAAAPSLGAGSDPLVGALENLGWNRTQATEAVAAQRQADPDGDDAAVLRGALQYLGAHRG